MDGRFNDVWRCVDGIIVFFLRDIDESGLFSESIFSCVYVSICGESFDREGIIEEIL